MAAIAHTFVEQNTEQTTTSITYVDVTGAAIASGNFVVGKKYLILITAQLSSSAANAISAQVVHGSTAFAESEVLQAAPGLDERFTYAFLTVWTAVSGEGIKLQFKSTSGSNTVRANFVSILSINLSDDVVENTDWFFGDRSTDDSITSAAFTAGGSVTFTPGSAGQDWLALAFAQYNSGSTTQSLIGRIARSGEASSTAPEARIEVNNASMDPVFGLARVFTLGAASNTLQEESSTSGATTQTRTHSSVFVFKLNAFRTHAHAYTDADASLSATDYATELQTIGITPAVGGDTWIGAYWGLDRQNSAREGEFRLQVDGADQPAGQTTANYQFDYGRDDTDEMPCLFSTMPSLTASAHTVDLDASADSAAATPAGQHRQLWAVTMELAGTEAASLIFRDQHPMAHMLVRRRPRRSRRRWPARDAPVLRRAA